MQSPAGQGGRPKQPRLGVAVARPDGTSMRSPLSRGQPAPPRPGTVPVAEAPPLLTKLKRDTLRGLAAGPFYRHTLIGRVPTDLRLRVGERWPGDAKGGATILAGEILFAGQMVHNPVPVWFPADAGTNWLAAWHGFRWVADILSVGGGATRRGARAGSELADRL